MLKRRFGGMRGSKLKEIIDEQGISISELARRLNVSPQTLYSMVKRDSQKVDFDLMMRICAELKVPVERMCENMQRDRAKHTILPLSKFGLMQITRQRVRPAVEVDVQEKCPFCDGSGTIKSSLVVVDEIETNLRYLISSQNEKKLTIITHPYVYAYLTKGLKSIRLEWMYKYKLRLTFKPSESYSLLDYKFFNAAGDEISM